VVNFRFRALLQSSMKVRRSDVKMSITESYEEEVKLVIDYQRINDMIQDLVRLEKEPVDKGTKELIIMKQDGTGELSLFLWSKNNKKKKHYPRKISKNLISEYIDVYKLKMTVEVVVAVYNLNIFIDQMEDVISFFLNFEEPYKIGPGYIFRTYEKGLPRLRVADWHTEHVKTVSYTYQEVKDLSEMMGYKFPMDMFVQYVEFKYKFNAPISFYEVYRKFGYKELLEVLRIIYHQDVDSRMVKKNLQCWLRGNQRINVDVLGRFIPKEVNELDKALIIREKKFKPRVVHSVPYYEEKHEVVSSLRAVDIVDPVVQTFYLQVGDCSSRYGIFHRKTVQWLEIDIFFQGETEVSIAVFRKDELVRLNASIVKKLTHLRVRVECEQGTTWFNDILSFNLTIYKSCSFSLLYKWAEFVTNMRVEEDDKFPKVDMFQGLLGSGYDGDLYELAGDTKLYHHCLFFQEFRDIRSPKEVNDDLNYENFCNKRMRVIENCINYTRARFESSKIRWITKYIPYFDSKQVNSPFGGKDFETQSDFSNSTMFFLTQEAQNKYFFPNTAGRDAA